MVVDATHAQLGNVSKSLAWFYRFLKYGKPDFKKGLNMNIFSNIIFSFAVCIKKSNSVNSKTGLGDF